MKANIPAAICFAAVLYCCWVLYRSGHTPILQGGAYRVEITVHGPNGTIVEPVGPAPSATPDSDPESY